MQPRGLYQKGRNLIRERLIRDFVYLLFAILFRKLSSPDILFSCVKSLASSLLVNVTGTISVIESSFCLIDVKTSIVQELLLLFLK